MPSRIRMLKLCSAKELCLPTFWRDVLIEIIISMFLLMFITFSLTTMNENVYKPSTTHIGIMVGFLVYLIIEAYGPLSGAHMNPAVTLGMFLSGRITFIRAVFYAVAQCTGGPLGSGIVYWLSPKAMRENFKPFTPAPDISPEEGMFIELLVTFNLVFCVLATTDDKNRTVMLPSLPSAFCVGTAIMAVGTWTGATLNPIVALGPAVISKNFSHHWIYWVGPLLGAACAVLLYKVYILAKNKSKPLAYSNSKSNLDTQLEEKPMLKEEVTALVEKILALSADYNRNPPNGDTVHIGSSHSLDSATKV